MTLNLILTFDVIITSNSVLSLARLSLRLNLNFKHTEELTSAVFKSLRKSKHETITFLNWRDCMTMHKQQLIEFLGLIKLSLTVLSLAVVFPWSGNKFCVSSEMKQATCKVRRGQPALIAT